MRASQSALGTFALLSMLLIPLGASAQTASAVEIMPEPNSQENRGGPIRLPAEADRPGTTASRVRFRNRSEMFLPEKTESLAPAARPQAPDTASRPRGEVYAGLVYNNLSLLGFDDRRHALGWDVEATAHLTRYFGLTADFGGQYDPECSENDVECLVELLQSAQIEDYNSHQFLGGPRLTIPGERFQGFVHVLFGGVRTHVSLLDTSSGQRTKITSGPNFAMAYGGGLDWNVGGPRFAVRLFQFDYIPVREDTNWRHNFRIQGGVVIRFGGGR